MSSTARSARGMSSTWRTSASLMCSVIRLFPACVPPRSSKAQDSPQNRLARPRFGAFHGDSLASNLARFPDAPYDRLHQPVDALFLVSLHDMESEFGLVFKALANANGQLSAKMVFNERGLVAASLRIPGVDAQRGEVACLALRPVRRSDEVLRPVAGRIRDAIQLKPRNCADVR